MHADTETPSEKLSTTSVAKAADDFEKIPSELKALLRWVCWEAGERGGKRTKIPIDPNGEGCASVSDSATWADFDRAVEFAREHGCGIGFMLGSGFVGMDLDHVREVETGLLSARTREIIDEIDSYTEVSPSGTGVHIIAKGILPSGGRKKGPLEMYSDGRYFTVTGAVVDDRFTVEERQAEIEALHRRIFGKSNGKAHASRTGVPTPESEDKGLVERACARFGTRFTMLYVEGDRAGYPSQSEADMRLCGMFVALGCQDPEALDRLFRGSKLFRPKWTEAHSSDGQTYGTMTIEKALSSARQSETGHRTDEGAALRLVEHHGGDIRYCHPWGAWMVWDGKRWRPDDTGEVGRRAAETAKVILREAVEVQDEEPRKARVKWALGLESAQRQQAMIQLARKCVPVTPDQFDRDPWLFNALNGTLNLRTGELRAQKREDLITRIARVEFDPKATAPTWDVFLDRIFGGNKKLIRFVRCCIGYSLTGDTAEQRFFLCYGTGANGKSTLLNTIRSLLADYARHAAPDLLLAKSGERHPTELADLRGARFVTIVELPEERRLNVSLLKSLTGGEPVKARRMREDFSEFPMQAKLWIAANHRPEMSESTHALWRRVLPIPFTVTIPPKEQDRGLEEKLKKELPGILTWAVAGCQEWSRIGLKPPRAVKEAVESYRDEQDVLGEFIETACERGPKRKESSSRLFSAYWVWADENHLRPLSKIRFAGRLDQAGFKSVKGSKGARMRVGPGLNGAWTYKSALAEPLTRLRGGFHG
ncbi:MAG: hypothetical protein HYX75_12995 [Acidobacteria bacterium]|nr:hypothetical protein [Acidobacteriota bacterium]